MSERQKIELAPIDTSAGRRGSDGGNRTPQKPGSPGHLQSQNSFAGRNTPKAQGKNLDSKSKRHFSYKWEDSNINVAKRFMRTNILAFILSAAFIAVSFIGVGKIDGASYSVSFVSVGSCIFVFTAIFGIIIYCKILRGAFPFYIILIHTMFILFFACCGWCLVNIDETKEYVRENWESIKHNFSADQDQERNDISSRISTWLIIIGIGSILLALISIVLCIQSVKLAGARKAHTTILGTINILLLPIGVLLMVAGFYIAETAETIDSPVTAFFMFLVGYVLVLIGLFGLFAVLFESRGMLLVFIFLAILLALLFIAFGLLVFIESKRISDFVTDNWASVKSMLPPTFSARYDVESFRSWINTNLLIFGYFSLVLAILAIILINSSMKLRRELSIGSYKLAFMMHSKDGKTLDKHGFVKVLFSCNPNTNTEDIHEILRSCKMEDKNSVITFEMFMSFMLDFKEGDSVGDNRTSVGRVQNGWKKFWSNESKCIRATIIVAAVVCVVILVVVLVLASLAFWYTSNCVKQGDYNSEYVYDFAADPDRISLQSTYTRSSLKIEKGTGTFDKIRLNVKAFNKDYANPDKPSLLSNTVVGVGNEYSILIGQKKPKKIAGLDMSCQKSELSYEISSNTQTSFYYDATGDYGEVNLNFETIPKNFTDFKISTTKGSVNVSNLRLVDDGMTLKTESGTIGVKEMKTFCDVNAIGDPKRVVEITSPKGSIELINVDLGYCSLVIKSEVASIRLKNVKAYEIQLSNDKGQIAIDTVECSKMKIESSRGILSVNGLKSSIDIKISAMSTQMKLYNVMSEGLIQVEGGSSEIDLTVSEEFKGIFSIASVTGTIQVTESTTVKKDAVAAGTESHSAQGTIFCTTRCAYYGEVIILSNDGNIKLKRK